MPGLAVQNYATYPSMPGALRALCPVTRGVTPGIRPYARCHGRLLLDDVVRATILVGGHLVGGGTR